MPVGPSANERRTLEALSKETASVNFSEVTADSIRKLHQSIGAGDFRNHSNPVDHQIFNKQLDALQSRIEAHTKQVELASGLTDPRIAELQELRKQIIDTRPLLETITSPSAMIDKVRHEFTERPVQSTIGAVGVGLGVMAVVSWLSNAFHHPVQTARNAGSAAADAGSSAGWWLLGAAGSAAMYFGYPYLSELYNKHVAQQSKETAEQTAKDKQANERFEEELAGLTAARVKIFGNFEQYVKNNSGGNVDAARKALQAEINWLGNRPLSLEKKRYQELQDQMKKRMAELERVNQHEQKIKKAGQPS